MGPQALVAGEIPLMAIGGTVVAPPVSEGADLVQISSSIHRLPSQIWAVPEIGSLDALRGKRLAITRPGTRTDFSARLALRQAALKPAEVVLLATVIGVPHARAGLLARAPDAGVVADPYSVEASKQGLLDRRVVLDHPTQAGEQHSAKTAAY